MQFNPRTEPEFQFDRPAEHGLAPRSFGEGSFARPETREAIADLIRDEILRHCDPADAISRHAGPGQVCADDAEA